MSDLPREGWIAGGTECSRCPWAGQCVRPTPDGVGVPDDTAVEIEALKQEALEAKDVESAGKEAGRKAKEQISALLRQHGARRAPGLARITYSEGRLSLDTKAMEADGIDLTPYRKAGKPSETVTLEK